MFGVVPGLLLVLRALCPLRDRDHLIGSTTKPRAGGQTERHRSERAAASNVPNFPGDSPPNGPGRNQLKEGVLGTKAGEHCGARQEFPTGHHTHQPPGLNLQTTDLLTDTDFDLLRGTVCN